jgi:hypothetical protein
VTEIRIAFGSSSREENEDDKSETEKMIVWEVLGVTDGAMLGASDGDVLGATDGAMLGATDGAMLGGTDGAMLGATDGDVLGVTDGAMLGVTDGDVLGVTDGDVLGATDGAMLGVTDGMVLGRGDGLKLGDEVGVLLGEDVGERVGTIEHSWALLFSRKNIVRRLRWQSSSGKVEDKLVESRYKAFSLVNFTILEGIAPPRRRLDRRERVTSITKFPRESGIVPLIELYPRSRELREVIFEIVEGSGLLRRLEEIVRDDSFVSWPKLCGNCPEKELDWSWREVKVTMLPREVGIWSEIRLDWTSNFWRFTKHPISEGRVPLRRLFRRSNNVNFVNFEISDGMVALMDWANNDKEDKETNDPIDEGIEPVNLL